MTCYSCRAAPALTIRSPPHADALETITSSRRVRSIESAARTRGHHGPADRQPLEQGSRPSPPRCCSQARIRRGDTASRRGGSVPLLCPSSSRTNGASSDKSAIARTGDPFGRVGVHVAPRSSSMAYDAPPLLDLDDFPGNPSQRFQNAVGPSEPRVFPRRCHSARRHVTVHVGGGVCRAVIEQEKHHLVVAIRDGRSRARSRGNRCALTSAPCWSIDLRVLTFPVIAAYMSASVSRAPTVPPPARCDQELDASSLPR